MHRITIETPLGLGKVVSQAPPPVVDSPTALRDQHIPHQLGSSEIPEYLFRLAQTAMRDRYCATATRHLREASHYLQAAARLAPDAARQEALRHVAVQVRLAATAASCEQGDGIDPVRLFAQAQLALADCEQRLALLAWLRNDNRRAGCHLDSAMRQLRRAEAWIGNVGADTDVAPATDAQCIADALADGWQVRAGRVSDLIFGLERDIARLSRTVLPMFPSVRS